MIDLTAENLIPLRAVPRHLPPRPNGKRLHVSAIYRWAQRGVRGVRLELIRIGGTAYTTREALQRFAEHLTGRQEQSGLAPPPTSRSRQRRVDRARERLDALLGPTSTRPDTGLVPTSDEKIDHR